MNTCKDASQMQCFTAVDAESGKSLVTIQAVSVEDAASRFLIVAPLVGIMPANLRDGLLWIPVAEPMHGPPTFLDEYFVALKEILPLDFVAPGPTTLQ